MDIGSMKLVAKAAIDESGLAGKKAQVILVLDISGSTRGLYQSGAIQSVTEKALALGLNFDDDGEIPVVLFGERAHDGEVATAKNIVGYTKKFVTDKHDLEQDTKYAKALRAVSKHIKPKGDPTFVMFVTDGDNSDRSETTELVRELSKLPTFIQFIGVGTGTEFAYLKKLDELTGRAVDNCGFCAAPDATKLTFEQLLNEFPGWFPKAQAAGII